MALCGFITMVGVSFGASQSPVFMINEQGYAFIEAESCPPDGPWQLSTKSSDPWGGYTGEGHYLFTGNSESGGNPTGHLEYRVYVSQAGTYKFSIRGIKDGSKWDIANDVYTKWKTADGNETPYIKTVSGGKNRWFWKANCYDGHDRINGSGYLTEGVNTFCIAGRSKNFYMDRIVIWTGNVIKVNEDRSKPDQLNYWDESGVNYGASFSEAPIQGVKATQASLPRALITPSEAAARWFDVSGRHQNQQTPAASLRILKANGLATKETKIMR